MGHHIFRGGIWALISLMECLSAYQSIVAKKQRDINWSVPAALGFGYFAFAEFWQGLYPFPPGSSTDWWLDLGSIIAVIVIVYGFGFRLFFSKNKK